MLPALRNPLFVVWIGMAKITFGSTAALAVAGAGGAIFVIGPAWGGVMTLLAAAAIWAWTLDATLRLCSSRT